MIRGLDAWEDVARISDNRDSYDRGFNIVTSPSPEQPDPAIEKGAARGPRPPIRQGLTVTEYTQGQLMSLIQWVESDGILRSDEELLTVLFNELGHRRRGIRMEAYLRVAIANLRKQAC